MSGLTENKYISSQRNDLLKLIALLAMFIDHIAHVGILRMVLTQFNVNIDDYNKYYTIFRTIGRIAFPIFAYQVALGYSKTSNLKKYIKRLLVFAIISSLPYMIFNYDFLIQPLHFNIIFTLLSGIIVIILYEQGKIWLKKVNMLSKLLSIILFILMIMTIMLPQFVEVYLVTHPLHGPMDALFSLGERKFYLNYDFDFSYDSYGILMVFFFHLFKGKPLQMILAYIILGWLNLTLVYVNLVYGNSFSWFGQQYTLLQSFAITPKTQFLIDYEGGFSKLDGLFFQMRSVIALPLIILLERFNLRFKLNKFLGYWFYPLHIIFLLICTYILKFILF